MRNQALAASPAGYSMWSQDIAASQPYKLDLKGPILIPPGTGLIVSTNNQNITITASFEWYEEAA
jgi:hypothetical protein